MAAIEANQDTVNNIRLWDWQPLQQTFRQLQQIRSYYTFQDVDIDRYRLGRQRTAGIALGPRAVARPARQGRHLGQPAAAVYPRLRPGHGAGGRQDARRPAGLHDRRHPAGRRRPSLACDAARDLLWRGGIRAIGSSTAACRSSTIRAAIDNVYTSYRGHGDVAARQLAQAPRLSRGSSSTSTS